MWNCSWFRWRAADKTARNIKGISNTKRLGMSSVQQQLSPWFCALEIPEVISCYKALPVGRVVI
jgi:hypothetical protein